MPRGRSSTARDARGSGPGGPGSSFSESSRGRPRFAVCLTASHVRALHQPVAHNLRFVITALKVDNDLERIADHATNIAEDVIYLAEGEIIRHSGGEE